MSILKAFIDKVAEITGADAFNDAQVSAWKNPSAAAYEAAQRAYENLSASAKAAVDKAASEAQHD